MLRKSASNDAPSVKRRGRPATSIEGRENQMIALAINLAEEQLRNGTASSQVITHYLKLGTTRERLEKEILEKKKSLMVAQTENLQSMKHIEELYTEAMTAMASYRGVNKEEEIIDEEYYED